MPVHLPLYFTLSLGRFLTTLDLHVQIICFLLLFRCSMGPCCKELEFLSTYSGILTFFYSVVFLISNIVDSLLILFLYSSVIMCGHLYVILQCYHSDYITCSGNFRLSVYTWGIHLTYIRRQLSSRFRFHVFGKRSMTNADVMPFIIKKHICCNAFSTVIGMVTKYN